MKKKLFKYRKVILAALFVLSVAYYFCLPKTLFQDPYATVLNTENGHLLSARIADDGQWRFPEETALPDKYIQAVITFEDKNFYGHPGVDPLAFGRAMVQNLRAGHVVSGGSTLSMQVIRLHRKGKSRTIWEKLVEVVLATRLELRYSKTEILELYASHAPFGGNTVGLSAASWRYFERQPAELSWTAGQTPNQMLYITGIPPGLDNIPFEFYGDGQELLTNDLPHQEVEILPLVLITFTQHLAQTISKNID